MHADVNFLVATRQRSLEPKLAKSGVTENKRHFPPPCSVNHTVSSF